jgi:hypothetical protein
VAAGTYFSDGFESGSLGQWDALSSSDSTIALDSSVANSGNSSVRFTNNSDQQSSRLYADLAGGGHAQSYTRFCFRIAPGVADGVEIVNGRAITADYPLGIRRFVIDYNPITKGLEGYFFNDALQRLDLYAANGLVLTGQWHCAELYLDESTNGHAQLWLDGVSVGSVAGDLSTPSPYSRIYLWNQPAAGTVWFDDVKVASTQIGPAGSGTGNVPAVTMSPASVDFGSETVGTTSVQQAVSITDTGGAPLTISSIGLTGSSGTDFAQTNNCPTSLAAGASCTATVTFTPTANGSRTSTMSIASNAANSPATDALDGVGVLPTGTFLTDGFESGLGQWTKIGDGTETAQSTTVNSGTAAAALTNTTAGGYAGLYADFAGQGQTQTYTRFCFNLSGVTAPSVPAQGRDANGMTLGEVDYAPGCKRVVIYFWNGARVRTDFYAAMNVVTPGQWYCAKVGLNQAVSGHAEVWLDGASIAATNGDFSASNNYSRLFLWNNGAIGTVNMDDVSVTGS